MAVTEETTSVKLVRHGDGLALVFDPALLRGLGIDENTPVLVSTDGQNIRITPAAAHATREQVEAAMKVVNTEWGPVLKKLAQ